MATGVYLSTRTNSFPHHKDANANIEYDLIKCLPSLPNQALRQRQLPGREKGEPFGSPLG